MQFERITFSWTRGVQPKDYETSKATGELTAVFEEGEQPSIDDAFRLLSGKVQSHVLAAVGLDPSKRGVYWGEGETTIEAKGTAEKPATTEAEQQAAGKAEAEAAATEPEPAPEPTHEEVGSDPASEPTDDQIKEAARAKAKQPGGRDELVTITQRYGLDRLTNAQGETRAKVLAELQA